MKLKRNYLKKFFVALLPIVVIIAIWLLVFWLAGINKETISKWINKPMRDLIIGDALILIALSLTMLNWIKKD